MRVLCKSMAALTAVTLVACVAASANAATIGSTTLGVVAADPFLSGGVAGNTVKTDGTGTFFSAISHANDSLWSNGSDGRMVSTYGVDLTGSGLASTDFMEAWGSEVNPGLTTPVTGLAAGQYDVYVVYASGTLATALQASLSGGTLATYDESNRDDFTASAGISQLSIAKLGTTAAGVTSFAVDIASDNTGTRELYIGVGYSPVAVPEPGSFCLAALSLLGIPFLRRLRNR